MRLTAGILMALVALMQCSNTFLPANAEGEKLLDVAAKKAVEESVAVPVGELWRDIYSLLVRQKGAEAARRLRYLLSGITGRNDPLDLAKFIMDKIKREVFNNRVNKRTWEWLTMELYEVLKEWWQLTPENPRDSADIGTWQALINLQKNTMGPALRGSNKIGAINDLLLDPELELIRKWVSEWKGAPMPRNKDD